MIKAYKGFNKDLTCTLGAGRYQYREGVWIQEKEANCGANGLHCCYNPLDVLHYYSDFDKSVYYLVAGDGDIHEDNTNTRISCTRMKLIKKLNKFEFVMHALVYMQEHPKLKDSDLVKMEYAEGSARNGFHIVRGKNPVCRAPMGTVIGMVQEEPTSRDIVSMTLYQIDGKRYLPNVPYRIDGREMKGVG